MPENSSQETVETPLEQAARVEAERETAPGQTAHDEHEADVLVADIDEYVAETDPASLPQAEAELNAWQIPTDPLEGISIGSEPFLETADEPLTAVFSARSESEANIIRGVLEAEGIPVTFEILAMPAMGGVFAVSETRWGDILVPASQAVQATTALMDAQEPKS